MGDAVLREFSAHTPYELATVIRLLLRRTNCREHIVELLKRALISKTSFSELSQGFAVVNHAYRVAIEAFSSRSGPSQNTVSLQQLETVIGQQSILSEKDMVSQVFYPHFQVSTGREVSVPSHTSGKAADSNVSAGTGNANCDGGSSTMVGATVGNASSDIAVNDAWRIPLHAQAQRGAGKDGGSYPVRSPYLVSVVVAYLRS